MKTTQHTKAREAAGMSYAISLSGVRERGGEKAGEHTAVKALACPSQRARWKNQQLQSICMTIKKKKSKRH